VNDSVSITFTAPDDDVVHIFQNGIQLIPCNVAVIPLVKDTRSFVIKINGKDMLALSIKPSDRLLSNRYQDTGIEEELRWVLVPEQRRLDYRIYVASYNSKLTLVGRSRVRADLFLI